MFCEVRGASYYETSAANVIRTVRYFKGHPDGRIATGMWTQPTWCASQFWGWFHSCLAAKINREDTRQWRRMTVHYQELQRLDGRAINEYYSQRVRHTGCSGLLRTPGLRKRYPEVNCQLWEE